MQYLLLLLLQILSVQAEIDRGDGATNIFNVVNHGRLNHINVLMFLEEISLHECTNYCVIHLQCQSVSYSLSAKLCELNDMEFDEIEADANATGWMNYGTPAKVDGGFSDWKDVTSCSKSCGHGLVTYIRSCDNPKPQQGGASCVGEEIKTEPCFIRICPIHGGWNEWNDISDCDPVCGQGLKMWNRASNNPLPSQDGLDCLTKTNERRLEETEPRSCFTFCGPSKKVCYGAKNDDYGTFTAPKTGLVKRVRLIHKSGKLMCTLAHGGRWGCSYYASMQVFGTFITDSNKIKVFPDTSESTYHLTGYMIDDDEIVIERSSAYNVNEGQVFKIWYGGDLVNSGEVDNSGKHCVLVDLIYET